MTFQFICSCRLTLIYFFPSSFFKQIFPFILKPKLQNPHFSHAWKRKYQPSSRPFAGRSVSQSRTIPWSAMRACCSVPSLALCNHQHIANWKPERRAGLYTKDQEGGLGNAQSQWSTSSASRHLLRFSTLPTTTTTGDWMSTSMNLWGTDLMQTPQLLFNFS